MKYNLITYYKYITLLITGDVQNKIKKHFKFGILEYFLSTKVVCLFGVDTITMNIILDEA